MIPGFRRLAGLYDDRVLPVDAPWDRPLVEASGADSWARPKMHDPQHYDYTKARYDLAKVQGYSDLSKTAKLKVSLDDAISTALAVLVHNPTAKTAYIKDPSGLLSADIVAKAAENWLTGKKDGSPSYGAFGFHNHDNEIYADGVEVFVHGEWGYEVTQALDQAQNNELEKNPPKVKVTRIKGKTAEGWRIDISKSFQHYTDTGLKAAEKRASELANKGIYPDDNGGGSWLMYPKALAQKWARKTPAPAKRETDCKFCKASGDSGCEMCSDEMD